MATVKRVPGAGAEKLKQFLNGMNNVQSRVGWLDSSKYENGFPVAAAAAQNELGNPELGIPPRSFIRTTVSEQRQNWRELGASGARAMMAGNETLASVMEKLAFQAEGDIAKKITQITSPPLKASTIKARQRKLANGKEVGSLTKPLLETGTMLNTLTHDVVQK